MSTLNCKVNLILTTFSLEVISFKYLNYNGNAFILSLWYILFQNGVHMHLQPPFLPFIIYPMQDIYSGLRISYYLSY